MGTRRGGWLGLGLYRSPRQRMFGGVAGGIGERLGVDPVLVRAMFAVLAVGGGAGLLLYLLLWTTIPEDRGRATVQEPVDRKGLALCLIVLGAMILLYEAGFWLGRAAAWAVGLATLGVAVMWVRTGAPERARRNRLNGRVADNPLEVLLAARAGPSRLLVGLALIGAGVATFLATSGAITSAISVIVAVATTTAGLALLFGPWTYRLAQQLGDERRERIRSQERAEMAAHLHDSVLQTLALIQRAEAAREMVALARNQERALRLWLNDGVRRREGTLAAAIEEAAAAVELQCRVPVEVVTVGDAALEEPLHAIVDAAREAMLNAAKHSGAERIAVYLEVEPGKVTAFVRDQGAGFDLASVASDRRGISDSIVARMERSGGAAAIVTDPGQGTEVALSVARTPE
jgi:signal transduction histidine kinase